MFQDKNVDLFPGNSAAVFLPSRARPFLQQSAATFPGRTVSTCPDKNAATCPGNPARMCQGSSAGMFPARPAVPCRASSAAPCPGNPAEMCHDRAADQCPGSSAPLCRNRSATKSAKMFSGARCATAVKEQMNSKSNFIDDLNVAVLQINKRTISQQTWLRILIYWQVVLCICDIVKQLIRDNLKGIDRGVILPKTLQSH